MLKLNKFQVNALIGMILGDGYLQKTGKKNARLRLEHSKKFKDYLEWKMKLLPNLFQGKPKHIKRVHPLTKKEYEYVRAQSNASPFLGKLRKLFYKDSGKKVIPEKLMKLLTLPIGLVIWYYDDGYYNKKDKNAFLYLGRMKKDDAQQAVGVIKTNFGLDVRLIDKKRKGFVVYFPPKETQKLKNYLLDYQVESLKYKIPN